MAIMPRKKDAKVLGRCKCPGCGGEMAVLQNARDYLYSQCDSCGCDQRNGKAVQSYLWNNTHWLEGEPESRPRNVPGSAPEKPVHEPEPKPDEPEKKQEKQDDKKRGGLAIVLVPLAILSAIALGVK